MNPWHSNRELHMQLGPYPMYTCESHLKFFTGELDVWNNQRIHNVDSKFKRKGNNNRSLSGSLGLSIQVLHAELSHRTTDQWIKTSLREFGDIVVAGTTLGRSVWTWSNNWAGKIIRRDTFPRHRQWNKIGTYSHRLNMGSVQNTLWVGFLDRYTLGDGRRTRQLKR